ncbi:MAG: MFS transporter [Lachnospiraceae bacterium]|nr:MFS transporter [Lachnospiraceae bacterium]
MLNREELRIGVSVFMVAFSYGLHLVGIAPILGVLNEVYADKGTGMIQMLQTIPYLTLILSSLLVGWFTHHISVKRLELISLLMVGTLGIIPFFVLNFWVLFATRMLIGFGFGLISPMNNTVITVTLPPERRAGFMGLHVVAMGVGAMSGSLIGGVLASIHYRYFFLIYLMAFVTWFFVQFTMRDVRPHSSASSRSFGYGREIWMLTACSFFHTILINAFSINLGIYVLQTLKMGTGVTGAVNTVNSVLALLVGVFFAKLSRFFGKYTIVFAIGAAAFGFGCPLVLPGIIGIAVTSACCGISLSCFQAGAMQRISMAVPPDEVAGASGVFSVAGSIGGLIGPIVLGYGAAVLGGNTPIRQFLVAFAGFTVLFLMSLVLVRREPAAVQR